MILTNHFSVVLIQVHMKAIFLFEPIQVILHYFISHGVRPNYLFFFIIYASFFMKLPFFLPNHHEHAPLNLVARVLHIHLALTPELPISVYL